MNVLYISISGNGHNQFDVNVATVLQIKDLSGFKQVVILLFITPSLKQLMLLSSDKLEDTNIKSRFGQVHSSVPK